MAHDLLTRESPEIIRFFQDIGHITELLRSEPDRYRPILNGDRYITDIVFITIEQPKLIRNIRV